MFRNECIDEAFNNPTRIAEMPRAVSKKCGFDSKPEPFVTKIAKLEADLKAQSEELQALKIENAQAELQIAKHNEVKAQLEETCDARIDVKVQEIANCSNDLQAITTR